MGFTSNLITDKSTGEDIKYRKFSREDIIKYGDMPAELMGRFSTVTQLHGHTVKSLRKILRDAKGSVLKSKIDLLNYMNSYFELGIKKYPQNTYLIIYYIQFNYSKRYNLNSVRTNLSKLKTMKK